MPPLSCRRSARGIGQNRGPLMVQAQQQTAQGQQQVDTTEEMEKSARVYKMDLRPGLNGSGKVIAKRTLAWFRLL